MNFQSIKNIIVLFLTGSFLVLQPAYAQYKDSLVNKFNAYREHAYQEKLYVHIDRNFFLTGETMWFKVYCVDGSFHMPSDLSKVVYVEVLDKLNKPVLQNKISISGGLGDGSFYLPPSFNSGNYRFRAYTQWMTNFSADFFFEKMVTIINPFFKPESGATVQPSRLKLHFFPEGGYLVNGLKSKVAFKATNNTGAGIDFQGALLNEANDTLLVFSPLKFGIGNFEFTPRPGQQYHVAVNTSNGDRGTYRLPPIHANGFVMHVAEQGQFLKVDVYGRRDDLPVGAPVYLFVHSRQIMAHAEMKLMQNGSASFIIEKKNLKEGISQITLFNEELKPACERLYFRQPVNKFPLKIKSTREEIGTRRKVTLEIEAEGVGNLSVAVFKIDSLNLAGHDQIFEHLWLDSDLTGFVESPDYYFTNDRDVPDATDNLMLTHGWRRFNWTAILGKDSHLTSSPHHLPEYHGLVIRGQVSGPDGKPVAGLQTYLSSPGMTVRLYESRSNKNGEVFYEMQDFFGARSVHAITDIRKDSAYQIKLQDPFASQYVTDTLTELHLSPILGKPLLVRTVGIQIQDIYNRKLDDHLRKMKVDSLPFYGVPDESYNLDDYTRFPVMEEVMREYVPGVFVRKRKDGFHFLVYDKLNKVTLHEDPLVLLDGVPVFNTNDIMALSPLKVKKLDVVDRQYYLGGLVIPGIVSYTTYKGDLGGFVINPQFVSMDYAGLQQQREFTSPLYENSVQRDNRIPDQRNLLYWNPMVTIGKNGKKIIEFYSSDQTGNYQVIIEGISADGRAGGNVCTFSVSSTGQ